MRTFIFGAGASRHYGLPLLNNFYKEGLEVLSQDKSIDIVKKLKEVLLPDIPDNMVNLEELLTLSQYYLRRELARDPTKFKNLVEAPEDNELLGIKVSQLFGDYSRTALKLLCDLAGFGPRDLERIPVGFVGSFITKSIAYFEEKKNKNYYITFVKDILKEDDCIITFNYDTLLDKALLSYYKEICYYLFIVPDQERQGIPWDLPKENSKIGILTSDKLKADSSPLYLKLHGSTHFLKRDSDNFAVSCSAFIPPASKPKSTKQEVDYYDYGAYSTLEIMPSHFKEPYQGSLLPLWDRAMDALVVSGEWFFIGCSLPYSDYRSLQLYNTSKFLREKFLKSKPKVYVVSPEENKAGSAIERYEGFFGEIQHIQKKFEDWCDSYYPDSSILE